MRRLRFLPWLLIPILAGSLVYARRTGNLQREWAALVRTDPVYDAPTEVVTDPVEVGEVAIAHFTITNRGGGELVVNGIRTSCACTGLERSTGDGYAAIEELRLGSGERMPVVVRLMVHQPSEKPQRYMVYVRTSDPTRPEANVAVVVPPVPRTTTVAPAGISFGVVPVGARVCEVLHVFHAEQHPAAVTHVASSDPHVSVRMLPNPRTPDPHGRGVPIGVIEVAIQTDIPATVDASVTILAEGISRALPPVPVFGRIAPPIEVLPRSVMLPIASSGGPINEVNCLFRAANGKPFDLRLESAPPGIAIDIQPATSEAQSVRMAKIRLQAGWDNGATNPRASIRFLTRQDSNEARIELPVLLNLEGNR